MISITCTQCQTVLTIDDAFAGGVCRCQHCGTIQTVPSALKATATPQPFANPANTKSKTLYQNEAAARTTGANVATTGAKTSSGLDDLATAVGASSSGLTGSGLRGAVISTGVPAAAVEIAPPAVATPIAYATPVMETTHKKSPLVAILIGAGAVILVLVGVIVFMVARPSPSAIPSPIVGTGGGGGSAFCGTSIVGSRVIYLLDDANSISNDFDPLRAATLQSINSVGSDHKFAVILWNNGDNQFAFPKDGMAAASSSQVEQLRGMFQDIEATGASRLRPSLDSALARNPDTVIIVTAKSTLDDDDASALTSAQENASGKIKFYTFTVGGDSDNPALKKAADVTGGGYRHLTSQELRSSTP